MSKHTPGPWQWTQHFDPTISIYKDGFGQIARLYDSSAGTGKANARLIAAAPDLLADLQEACDRIEDLVSRLGGTDPEKATESYRATIAKATGGAA